MFSEPGAAGQEASPVNRGANHFYLQALDSKCPLALKPLAEGQHASLAGSTVVHVSDADGWIKEKD